MSSSPTPNASPSVDLRARQRARQTKILFVFAIGSGLVLLFCFVPMVLFIYLFGPVVTRDPAAVRAVAEKIGPLAIPPDFVGFVAQSAHNSLWDIHLARFDHSEGRGRLVVGQLHLHFAPAGSAEDASLLSNAIDNSFPSLRTLDVKSTRELTLMIHGQEVTFEIQSGEDLQSTTQYKQVSGKFTGAAGAVQILLQAESEFLTDDAIDSFLKSFADQPASDPAVKRPKSAASSD